MSDGRSFEDRKSADELSRRAAEREHDRIIEHGNRLNESATRDAQGAIRVLLAINGGASVAILAFIGASKARGELSIDQLHLMVRSLSYFVIGALTTALAAIFAYLTNLNYAGAALLKLRTWEYPYSIETKTSKRSLIAAKIFHVLGILGTLSGIILFVIGMMKATAAINALK
jgi:hypothetical protein